jgi:hypothetical protein
MYSDALVFAQTPAKQILRFLLLFLAGVTLNLGILLLILPVLAAGSIIITIACCVFARWLIIKSYRWLTDEEVLVPPAGWSRQFLPVTRLSYRVHRRRVTISKPGWNRICLTSYHTARLMVIEGLPLKVGVLNCQVKAIDHPSGIVPYDAKARKDPFVLVNNPFYVDPFEGIEGEIWLQILYPVTLEVTVVRS